jgi:5-carboxymethyl-2-hydroxymuconate isomerase
VDYDG